MLSGAGHAFRLMRRNPGWTAVALASIAIGTSASAVVFAAVKAVLLTPLPYAKAGNLVAIRTDFERGNPHEDWVSRSDMQDAAAQSGSFDSTDIYDYAVVNLAGDANTLPEALLWFAGLGELIPDVGRQTAAGAKHSS